MTFSNQVCPFNRINGDIYFWSASTYVFSDIKHRSFINFAFSDNHSTRNANRIKRLTHSIYSKTIGCIHDIPQSAMSRLTGSPTVYAR